MFLFKILFFETVARLVILSFVTSFELPVCHVHQAVGQWCQSKPSPPQLAACEGREERSFFLALNNMLLRLLCSQTLG